MRLAILLSLFITATLLAAQPDAGRLTAWAGELDAAFARGEGEQAMTTAMDVDRFLVRVVDGLDFSGEERKGFIEGAKKNFSLSKQIHQTVQSGGSYRFRRILDRPDGQRPLFRLVDPNGASNWHELVMADGPDGKPRIIDVHMYTTGELLSVTVRQSAAIMLGEKSGFFARLVGRDGAKQTADRFMAVVKANREERWRDSLTLADQLPERLRETKMAWILRIQAASKLDQPRYLRELETFAKRFPDDPAQLLMSVDAHFMLRRFDQAQAVIDQLERLVGKDAQLSNLRANIAQERGDLAAAKTHATQATTLEGDWKPAWFSRIAIALKAKDNADVVIGLEHLSTLGVTFKDLSTVPLYAEFAKSPEYGAWKAKRAPAP